MRCLLGLSLCAGALGFVPISSRISPVHRTPLRAADGDVAPSPVSAPDGWLEVDETMWGPEKKADIRIEGGGTLRTFQMPAHAERVQYMLRSPGGRPVKAKVELWIGPIRCTHELMYDCMNGESFPLRVMLTFKKVQPVLKISTDSTYEFPLECGVFVPSPEESAHIAETTDSMFYNAPIKETVQGGDTSLSGPDTGGAIRAMPISSGWEKTQVMITSRDVGKKSFKSNVEILQGPNNPKQFLNLRCGGSTQPIHFVIDTPGPGWIVRCNSKKYIADGKFQIAMGPYGETSDVNPLGDVVVGGGGTLGMGAFGAR